ncbi:hypothetical protein CH254_19755 [Rhodococcus sp. 06-412-2C]|uniref:aminotransferase class III-fold pyridoxal phosphate-dependent enzyme n=1 Tax=unclassified Rhodococcus (in: high G+C Gram-positive bacteria) TaxID=192944 RepID=UPI000B9B8857|nr:MULTISPECIES: aminotransferase class III-fold pyridoxal phosphate-dependent enzyme [unclassified Rhodococcus (in: high G+C Gram-positive bacteria)]OZC84655.1 hypothetical protein CH254_19755 [Rhodococcus sp. 06-412-2C]OZC98308.1 hypothetical protein CH279_12400 [Rhodococcus sp. 06-412-2B]
MTDAPARPTDSLAESTTTLEALLRDGYGLTVTSMKFLGGELDRNYRVRTPDAMYLAKFQLRAADRAELQWQEDILLHLAEQDLHVPVPTVVRTVSGAPNLAVDSGPELGTLRVFEWVHGTELAKVAEHTDVLLTELGSTAAHITEALSGFTASDLLPTHHWDVTNSRAAIESCIAEDPGLADLEYVRTVLAWFDAVEPRLPSLPTAVVHHDLNDNNVLVSVDGDDQHVSGVLDFNDALRSARVAELAVAGAYAMLRKRDPLGALGLVVTGYNDVAPLTDDEIDVVFPLAAARLCVQVLTWTSRGRIDPTAYGRMRMQYTLPTLLAVARLDPAVASAHLRSVCGRVASPATDDARHFVANATPATILGDSRTSFPGDSADSPVRPAVGEPATYSPHLAVHQHRADIWRPEIGEPETVSLGSTFWLADGSVVCAPLGGRVVETEPLVLEHGGVGGAPYAYSVWSGVRPLAGAGRNLAAGEPLGETIDLHSSGTPILRVQIVATRDLALRLPAYVSATDAPYWAHVCIDPAPWFGRTRSEKSDERSDVSGFVRGQGVWLYDNRGVRYLDARSEGGVHVAHGDRRIVTAANRQMLSLDVASDVTMTSRLLTRRILSSMPASLDTVLFTDTADHALRLAERLAERATGRTSTVRPNEYSTVDFDPSAPPAAVIVQAVLADGVHPASHELCASVCAGAKAAGSLVIVDESTSGPGRSGTHLWQFDALGIVPDIVVLGRRLANGHPIAAVVTTSEIAHESEVDGTRYNANPVSAAIAATTLDIIEADGLLQRAHAVGAYLRTELTTLASDVSAVSDVRSWGLMAGIELSGRSMTSIAAATYTRAVRRRLAQHSVLIGQSGMGDNVLTVDPPMTFSHSDVDLLVARLADVFTMADIRPADTDSSS